MQILIGLLLIVAMFLCWAVGGEYRFGKGKRGLLLAIPLTLFGIGKIPWIGLAVQPLILWGIYQCLFYDKGIELVYEKKDKQGWMIIGLNGAMIGLTGYVFDLAAVTIGVLAGVLGFIGVVRLSNDDKFKSWRTWLTKVGPQAIPYTDDKGNKGYYINFKDAWWVSEGIMGAIVAIALLVALW